MQTKAKKRYIYDLVLIVSVLAVCLFLFFFLFLGREEGTVVEVSLDGEVVGTYSLLIEAEYTIGDGSNILKIEDGKAYMLYADCPEGICKGQGKIYMVHESISCKPNRVFVLVK